MKKYHIELTQGQRQELERLIKAGQARARQIMHAHILLKAIAASKVPSGRLKRLSKRLMSENAPYCGGASALWNTDWLMPSNGVHNHPAPRSAFSLADTKRT